MSSLLRLPSHIRASDLIDLEEALEDKLLGDVHSSNGEITVYERPPEQFTGLDAWLVRTDIRCCNCTLQFSGIPYPVPFNMKEEEGKTIYGVKPVVACSINCAAAHIVEIHRGNKEQMEAALSILPFIYYEFTGKWCSMIVPAKSRFVQKQYGGDWAPEKYAKHLADIAPRPVEYAPAEEGPGYPRGWDM